MTLDRLNNKEIVVLNEIAQKSLVSQRQLSERTGISLGLINAILKRLIETGYIKASRLNNKKLQYILTPEGFSAQAQRAYRYIVSTIKRYREIRSQIQAQIASLHQEGFNEFVLIETGEISDIVELIIREDLKEQVTLKRDTQGLGGQAVLLRWGRNDVPPDYNGKVADLRLEVAQ